MLILNLYIFFDEMYIQISCLPFTGSFVSLSFERSLNILDACNLLSDKCFAKIFSLWFIFFIILTVSFEKFKVLVLMNYNSLIFSFIEY